MPKSSETSPLWVRISRASLMPHKPIEAMTEGAAGLSGSSPVIKKRDLSWRLTRRDPHQPAAVGFISRPLIKA